MDTGNWNDLHFLKQTVMKITVIHIEYSSIKPQYVQEMLRRKTPYTQNNIT